MCKVSIGILFYISLSQVEVDNDYKLIYLNSINFAGNQMQNLPYHRIGEGLINVDYPYIPAFMKQGAK